MPPITVTPPRHDPYRNFRFRVVWDGRPVAGVTRVSALRRGTDVVEHRDGSDPSTTRTSPGRTKYEPVTLERGVSHDGEFEQWANQVWRLGAGAGSSVVDFRKDVRLELHDEAGELIAAYTIHGAWVSEYQALPDLDAGATTVAIESITLEHEGWERDVSVPPATGSPVDP